MSASPTDLLFIQRAGTTSSDASGTVTQVVKGGLINALNELGMLPAGTQSGTPPFFSTDYYGIDTSNDPHTLMRHDGSGSNAAANWSAVTFEQLWNAGITSVPTDGLLSYYDGDLASAVTPLSTITDSETLGTKDTFIISNTQTAPMLVHVELSAVFELQGVADGDRFQVAANLYFDNGSGVDALIHTNNHVFAGGSTTNATETFNDTRTYSSTRQAVAVMGAGSSLTMGLRFGLLFPTANHQAAAGANSAAAPAYAVRGACTVLGITHTAATVTTM